jgi:hypothetical protein
MCAVEPIKFYATEKNSETDKKAKRKRLINFPIVFIYLLIGFGAQTVVLQSEPPKFIKVRNCEITNFAGPSNR